ncbi:MAG: MGMT family protein [Acidilobaceae archaeon]
MPLLVLREDGRVSRAKLEDYEEAVYALVQLLEPGALTTYGCLGRALRVSARLVGRALSRNKSPIVIPCHRVVGRKSPGGYSLSVSLKKRLLALEGLRDERAIARALIECRDFDEFLSSLRELSKRTGAVFPLELASD